MTNLQRTRLVLHLCAGGAVVLSSIVADDVLGRPSGWGLKQVTLLAVGAVILAIGLLPPLRAITRISANLCVSVLSLFLSLAVIEGVVRVTRFDVFREEEAWSRIPIFYRVPTEPTGEIFFKRPGPDRWSGQVLSTQLRHLGIAPNPYSSESTITVEYDRNGFRNPRDMSDWRIAVAGDSHTEMGYLSYEQVFTAIMARQLNVPVLNLGVSDTGPLTHLHYLDAYGTSPSTRHTVIVFFEGNDLSDLAGEYAALDRKNETGQRQYREFGRGSFLRPLYMLGRRALHQLFDRGQTEYVAAYFQSSHGSVPVSLLYAPPASSDLPQETLRQFDDFVRKYAQFGQERRLEPWLAYMPAERRVLHGHLEFSASAPATLKNWQPNDLPEALAAVCNRYGIGFINLTPALIRETTRSGRLLYNSIYDLHLNAEGSRVVGEELIRHFSGLVGPKKAGHDVRREVGQ